jgi:hypothetical protein
MERIADPQPAAAAPFIWRLATLIVLLLLSVATAYEAGVALGWLSLGTQPGEGPEGGGAALGLALLAMLVAAGVCIVRAFPAQPPVHLPDLLLAPAAAAFATARFYTFDPYYLPTLRRMSDGGIFAPAWIYTLISLALLTAVVLFVAPRIGLGAAAAVLLLSAFTALVEATGH